MYQRLSVPLAVIFCCAPLLVANAAHTLPDPDGKPADMTKPVQVYILLGQSNMLGFGKIGPAHKNDTLEHAVQEQGK